jgi:glycerophosphoryl diester phosphodiesterase
VHLYDSIPKPVVFAHRGASRYAPENTIAAFDMAISQGVKALELDTMLTSDRVPVVIHDHILDRTTNGTGEVSQKTVNEIRELDAGQDFSEGFKDEKVPLLEEVLKSYRDGFLFNIELKNYHAPKDDLARIVLGMVESYGMLDQVLFSSFIPRNLKILRSLQPNAKVALLTPDGILGVIFRSFLYMGHSPEIIHPSWENVTRDSIEKEHRRGRCVNVWTVNDPQLAKNLIDWGIDGIITDDPKGILPMLGQ